MHTETTYSISVDATLLNQQHWATLLAEHPLGYTMPGNETSSLASAGTCSEYACHRLSVASAAAMLESHISPFNSTDSLLACHMMH